MLSDTVSWFNQFSVANLESASSSQLFPGYYCVHAAWTSMPDDYTYSNYTLGDCLCPSNITGGLCRPGFYCPEGSSEPIPCEEGHYCLEYGRFQKNNYFMRSLT